VAEGNGIQIAKFYKIFFSNHDIFYKISGAGAGVGAAIRNFGSGMQFNFGSSALVSGFATQPLAKSSSQNVQ
jgi:hypothetical protein